MLGMLDSFMQVLVFTECGYEKSLWVPNRQVKTICLKKVYSFG